MLKKSNESNKSDYFKKNANVIAFKSNAIKEKNIKGGCYHDPTGPWDEDMD
ncbi:hypothetical protein KORDIASMS9_04252 [Kordia sp. SMS9]|uniref:hypothetical protein n=1 Tax=Kordia sp. SMS9 TaxID=2282170 RepID=UPI000E106B30|nr:hypothetical protein [Kordia sp. SMS9]AXG71991.1 hypothetical protein KORDIASMS9_04252 [Kordia sp. SMS9]